MATEHIVGPLAKDSDVIENMLVSRQLHSEPFAPFQPGKPFVQAGVATRIDRISPRVEVLVAGEFPRDQVAGDVDAAIAAGLDRITFTEPTEEESAEIEALPEADSIEAAMELESVTDGSDD